jgi:hypothetical protein
MLIFSFYIVIEKYIEPDAGLLICKILFWQEIFYEIFKKTG